MTKQTTIVVIGILRVKPKYILFTVFQILGLLLYVNLDFTLLFPSEQQLIVKVIIIIITTTVIIIIMKTSLNIS